MATRARPALLPSLAASALLACATAGPRSSPPPARPPPSVAAAPQAHGAGDALSAGEAALRANAFARAEALLSEAERLDPVAPGPTALRARAVFHQARFDEALALARAAIEKGETPEARMVEGRTLAIRRELDAAIRSFERVTVLSPADADGWSALAAARLAVGDQRGGEAAFAEAARRLGPTAAEDRVWGDIARMQPDPYQIEEALDRCSRGTAALLAGKHGQARYEMRAVLGTVPTFAHCWSEMGKAAWRLGDLPGAEEAFRNALAAYRPDQAGLRADTEGLLAALLVERGERSPEAIALARAAIARRGPRPALVETLARACALAGDTQCEREAIAETAR